MRLLRPVRVRLFLVVFVASALHFATNVVREHYPAFALSEHGNLRCDDWAGLSPDLFRHDDPVRGDGYWYANNNVGASLVAAPLLFLFRPLLSKLEEIGKRQAAADPAPAPFSSAYPMRQKFMAEARRRGIHLRLGAAAAITATLLMAPAAALLALLVFDHLRRRGIAEPRAAALALLFAFATPLLFRSAILNHNQLEALAAFASYCVLDRAAASGVAPSRGALLGAGLLAGACVLLDYSGLVLLGALGIAAIAPAIRRGGLLAASRAAASFALGAAPPILLLWFTQWWQFGAPFAPAQRWMPDAHYSVRGFHGLAAPSPDLVGKNLVDPSFGLFAFAPILLLALLPPWRARAGLPASGSTAPGSAGPISKGFALALTAALVLFCASNQFTRLQWNTGLRAMAPAVPFLFVAASGTLAAMRPATLALVAAPCVANAWVVAMARATPPLEPAGFADSTIARSWAALFEHGLQLPWFTVWRQTQPGGGPAWTGFAAAAAIAATAALLIAVWRLGGRATSAPHDPAAAPARSAA
jgi:hypothetical protein